MNNDIYYMLANNELHLCNHEKDGYALTNQPTWGYEGISPYTWGWRFDTHGTDGTLTTSVTKVVIEDEIKPRTCYDMFMGMESLTEIEGLENLDTSQVENMREMFCFCRSLESLDLSGLDTGNVTNMSHMFHGCSFLESLDLSGWDTSSLDCMRAMFAFCTSLKDVDFSGWKAKEETVSRAERHDGGIFQYCDNLSTRTVEQITHQPPIFFAFEGGVLRLRHEVEGGEGWSRSWGDVVEANADITKVVIEDRVTLPPNSSYFFSNLENLTSIEGLENLDMSKVEDMALMFADCTSLKSLDLSGWDVSNVTAIHGMCEYCTSLESVNLCGWDTSNMQYYDDIFNECPSLKTVTLDPEGCRILPEIPSETVVPAGNGSPSQDGPTPCLADMMSDAPRTASAISERIPANSHSDR